MGAKTAGAFLNAVRGITAYLKPGILELKNAGEKIIPIFDI